MRVKVFVKSSIEKVCATAGMVSENQTRMHGQENGDMLDSFLLCCFSSFQKVSAKRVRMLK